MPRFTQADIGVFIFTGQDGQRQLSDLAQGTIIDLTFPNDLANLETGKNRNTVITKNETGNNADVVLRILRGSDDDNFLLQELQAQRNNFADRFLPNAQFSQRIGNGEGGVVIHQYTLTKGIFTKNVEAQTSASGETEQAVSVYNLRFSNADRAIV